MPASIRTTSTSLAIAFRIASALTTLLAALVATSGGGAELQIRSRRGSDSVAQAPAAVPTKLVYPTSRPGDHVDTYHGEAIKDPYRWLEQLDSAETRAWVAAQNQVTFGYVERLPQRARFKQRLSELWNYERHSIPHLQGGRYFFQRNDGLQNQPILYVADRLDAAPRPLVDPNQLARDGTAALSGWRVSRDGKLLAYGIARAGSDWREWRVRDVTTGRDFAEVLKWIKFSDVSWTVDHKGFFYSRYDEPKSGQEFTGANYHQKLYYHRVGEPQSSDKLIYERPDHKEWAFDGQVTEDGRLLVVKVWRGTERKHQILVRRLAEPESPWIELVTGFDARYELVTSNDDSLWLHTDRDAPQGRIVGVRLSAPQPEAWETIVRESSDVLIDASAVGRRLIVRYLRDAASKVRVFKLDGGEERDVELPGWGSVEGFHGWKSDGETFFSFSNFATPPSIYRYDIETGKSTVFRTPRVAFTPADFEQKQVFYLSKDGTRVPMTLIYKRGLAPNGENPTLLHAYGGFNVSLTPSFSLANIVWLERGGLLAVANLRGGGEYGRAWHEAGMLANKQNVFDDFIAAAQWLIDNKYTNSKRLAITGRSNGGLLIGAAMTQRPELFAAALPGVGVLDMLRYHKFTIGWAWQSEYGSSDDPEQFRFLRAYSPLHNLKPGVKYPATLITTGDHDDRVVPAHSYKFAAALQACQAGDAPVLIRIETQAGHGAGTPTAKLIDAAADTLGFVAETLKLP